MTEILSLGFLAVPWRPENTRAETAVRVGLTLCAVAVLAIFFSYVTNALDSPDVAITELRCGLGSGSQNSRTRCSPGPPCDVQLVRPPHSTHNCLIHLRGSCDADLRIRLRRLRRPLRTHRHEPEAIHHMSEVREREAHDSALSIRRARQWQQSERRIFLRSRIRLRRLMLRRRLRLQLIDSPCQPTRNCRTGGSQGAQISITHPLQSIS